MSAVRRCTCYLLPHANDCEIFVGVTQSGERVLERRSGEDRRAASGSPSAELGRSDLWSVERVRQWLEQSSAANMASHQTPSMGLTYALSGTQARCQACDRWTDHYGIYAAVLICGQCVRSAVSVSGVAEGPKNAELMAYLYSMEHALMLGNIGLARDIIARIRESSRSPSATASTITATLIHDVYQEEFYRKDKTGKSLAYPTHAELIKAVIHRLLGVEITEPWRGDPRNAD